MKDFKNAVVWEGFFCNFIHKFEALLTPNVQTCRVSKYFYEVRNKFAGADVL